MVCGILSYARGEVNRTLDGGTESVEERASRSGLNASFSDAVLAAVGHVEWRGGREGGRARWITSFSLIVLSRGTPREIEWGRREDR